MFNNNLLSHIYGPYPHHVLFSKKFPVVGHVPVLSNLQMLCDDKPIGFDKTEYIVTPPPDSIVAKHPVYFSGILRIESLDWLSEEGLRCLETDFKNYDNKIHEGDNRSGLTLQRLYGSLLDKRLWIKVEVVYEKVLFAAYLTSRNQHEHLLIYGKSGTGHVTFSIKSLQKTTYDMSRNFLDRFRLRALIVELIELDEGKTRLADRNIDWLLDLYFQHIIPRDLKNRIITDPSLDREILLEPRHPRHIPLAEIRGYFASHAEWLLANQLASLSTSANVKLVDIPQWISFCLQVRAEVDDARNYGIRWGVPHKSANESNIKKGSSQKIPLSESLAKYGQTESFWAKKLENVDAQRKAAKNKQSKRRSVSPRIEPLQTSMPTIVSQFQYDSDFSEASTIASSDSEDEPFLPTSKIPYYCLRPPEIPNGRFVWNCPGCEYYVDLLNLSPDILNQLPDDTKRVLGGKSWKIKDEPIQRLLFQVVSDHYRDHHLSDDVKASLQASGSGNEWYSKDSSERSSTKQKTYASVKVKAELMD